MAQVVFTAALQRYLTCPPREMEGRTVREVLDRVFAGDRLACGSTTGSLRVSEDQGDHWTCVSANLPPVYCVRFGG